MNSATSQRRVSVVITVKNDPPGTALALESLVAQTRAPDEIVVVDGGSTDGTPEAIRAYETRLPMLRVISAPGANIAAGRNRGVREATGAIIATTDGGCKADAQWLARLVRPFDDDPSVEFVAGFYRVTGLTHLERVIGLATMRGQLEDIQPHSYNPSARSLALTRELWQRVGGWPEWVDFSEDTLFDHQVRQLGAKWVLAPDAIVHWRPRRSFRALARQFYLYGTGRGQTGIDAAGYRYNIRNLFLMVGSALAGTLNHGAFVFTAALAIYFGWWAHHDLALRVARRMGSIAAYATCLMVMNVVTVAGAIGFVAGWWRQRGKSGRVQNAANSSSRGVVQPA